MTMPGGGSTTASPSTGDTFSQAQQNINDQKAALVAAIAQGGSAGKAAYQQAIDSAGAQKQSAIQSMLAGATRGDPSMGGQIQAQIAAPYDRTTTDLTSAMASRQASLAQRQANASTYMDQATAAIPAMRTMAENHLADLRAKAAQQQASLAASEQLKQMSLAEAGMRLAAMRAASAPTVGSIISKAGGAPLLGNQLWSAANQQQTADAGGVPGQPSAPVSANAAEYALANPGTPYLNLGPDMGLSPGTAQALALGSPDALTASKTAAAAAAAQNAQQADSGAYSQWSTALNQGAHPQDAYGALITAYGQTEADKVIAAWSRLTNILPPPGAKAPPAGMVH